MKTDHPRRPPGHLQTLPRRQFVKLAALTGGAIAAPAITPFSLLGRGEIAPPDAGMTRIELAHEDYEKDLTDLGPWTGMAAAEEGGTICKQLDPERYYQPSSPYGGANANDPREDNTHGYSNMCFVPGYDYLNFASEYNRLPRRWWNCCAGPHYRIAKGGITPSDLATSGLGVKRALVLGQILPGIPLRNSARKPNFPCCRTSCFPELSAGRTRSPKRLTNSTSENENHTKRIVCSGAVHRFDRRSAELVNCFR